MSNEKQFYDIIDALKATSLFEQSDASIFKLIFKEAFTVAEGISLSVCSLEGLVILKLIANNINPDRTKDIIDIEHILEVYFELNANEI